MKYGSWQTYSKASPFARSGAERNRPAQSLNRLPDDVSEEEKTRRIVALQGLQRDIQSELHQQAVGRTETVLVDSRSRRRGWELSGRTSGNTVVNFTGDETLIGQLVPVTITEANPNSLRGALAT